MADNFNFTEGSGKTGAADEIGGVLYPRVKITLGADGAADGDVVRIHCRDDDWKVYINGSLRISATSSAHSGATDGVCSIGGGLLTNLFTMPVTPAADDLEVLEAMIP